MLCFSKIKGCINAETVRAHVCTLALSLGIANLWVAPREAYRYGALSWGLAYAASASVVALPVALIHLAVGQLSRQDCVGMWRAVPFFKGVGYVRLMTSFLTASYTLVYLAVIMTYLLRSIFNLAPLWACTEQVIEEFQYFDETTFYDILDVNGTSCINDILTEPFAERPEFYLGLVLVIIAFWFAFPFILYRPTKILKRVYYVLGPLVFILAIVIVACIGDKTQFLTLQESDDWLSFFEPDFWNSCMTNALWSSQIAGGFLVSAGGTLYADMDVRWTALVFVATNVLATLYGLCFWFAIGGRGEPTPFAVLVQIHNAVEQNKWSSTWSALTCITLLLSGIITMLMLLYPLYHRFQRVGGERWRIWNVGSSVVGIAVSLAVLAASLPTLQLIEQYALPFLISLTTLVEVMTFVIIYGWKNLEEDIAFLTDRERGNLWIGWCLGLCTLGSFTAWWVVVTVSGDVAWTDGPLITIAFIATAALLLTIFVIVAAITVAKQDQFDCIGKLMSSFRSSRHWGPRDPMTHHAWLSRRQALAIWNPHPRIHRRQLGQLSGGPVLVSHTPQGKDVFTTDTKPRNNSDDYVYTEYRRKNLDKDYLKFFESKFRSKSLN